MPGKRYQAAKQQVKAEPITVESAVHILKEMPPAKFDETIEVHVHLGIDPEKSDQMVRGTLKLPHGTPHAKRVIVFTEDSALQKETIAAGAAEAGGEEIINRIVKDGNCDADVTIATPDMMPKIAKVAKILGPKGLMPNPKTGTMTPDPVKAVKELGQGKISFRMDQLGNIHEVIAKMSWSAEKITGNIQALIDAVAATRPAAARGKFIKKIVIKSTMSPSLLVNR